MLPASDTKNQPVVQYLSFHLQQSNDGMSNGTGLWLGAQVLSAFLSAGVAKNGMRVMELGSGVGALSLCLASLGCTIVASDLPWVIAKVLGPNVANNTDFPGTVLVRQLDWSVPPHLWLWDHPTIIASPEHSPQVAQHLTIPFDLVVSADTIYRAGPHHTAPASLAVSSRSPVVFICLERRDPLLTDQALREAEETWAFTVKRVPRHKVERAVQKMFNTWRKSDWEGVEIYKLVLRKE
ncbi:hypothetical protein C8F01DRAFT_1219379 [Mycena amicta]|nr:hypothetical protein C8F01DRAFT_1219379 [Mycena amicta]